jgi:hypothetical protein
MKPSVSSSYEVSDVQVNLILLCKLTICKTVHRVPFAVESPVNVLAAYSPMNVVFSKNVGTFDTHKVGEAEVVSFSLFKKRIGITQQ